MHLDTEEQKSRHVSVAFIGMSVSTEPSIGELTGFHDRSCDADEEDPFGHGACMDEPQTLAGVCGHATLVREFAQTVAVDVDVGTGPGQYQDTVSEATLPSAVSRQATDGGLHGAHTSHVLTRTAHVVWCRVCGRHAALRLGVGLQRPCVGIAVGDCGADEYSLA